MLVKGLRIGKNFHLTVLIFKGFLKILVSIFRISRSIFLVPVSKNNFLKSRKIIFQKSRSRLGIEKYFFRSLGLVLVSNPCTSLLLVSVSVSPNVVSYNPGDCIDQSYLISNQLCVRKVIVTLVVTLYSKSITDLFYPC